MLASVECHIETKGAQLAIPLKNLKKEEQEEEEGKGGKTYEKERRVTECVLTPFLFRRCSMSAVAEEDNEERGRHQRDEDEERKEGEEKKLREKRRKRENELDQGADFIYIVR